jgi:hypothetical protein
VLRSNRKRGIPMPEQTPQSAAACASSNAELLKLPARHAGKCAVCRSGYRVGIELRFLQWGKPAQIAHEHQIKNRASIYRHAHAANLFERRHRRTISIYNRTLEKFELGQVTGHLLRIASDQFDLAALSLRASSALANQDWVRTLINENPTASRIGRRPHHLARQPKPKSQHRQWGSRMSLILKTGKPLNPGKIKFDRNPKTSSSSRSGTLRGMDLGKPSWYRAQEER